jgi:hypothetical protein
LNILRFFLLNFDRKIIPEIGKTMKNDRIQNTRQNFDVRKLCLIFFGVSVFDEIKCIKKPFFFVKKLEEKNR